ncbi:MAG: SdrD B-like domain-containing protein, partial [Bacillota bacterium]
MHLSVAGPVGPEMSLPGSGPLYQYSIAADAEGDFVLAWGTSNAILAQRYDALGKPQGDTFQVNVGPIPQFTKSFSLGMDADGDFVVAWYRPSQNGSSAGILARQFSAGGLPQGDEFAVSLVGGTALGNPVIAMAPSGEYAIGWRNSTEYTLLARRYNAAGEAQGSTIQLGATNTQPPENLAIALAPDGSLVAAWDNGQGVSAHPRDVWAQRIDAAGTSSGVWRVNSYTDGDQVQPMVAADSAGNFTIAWNSDGQDGDGDGVYAQRYDASGHPLGGEFRANTETTDDQTLGSIAMTGNGELVIAWTSYWQDGSRDGIYAQFYSADGQPQGDEFRANTHTYSEQASPYVALQPGGFIVTWSNPLPISPYYNYGTIMAQRYGISDEPAAIHGRIWGDANGNGLQDTGEASFAGVRIDLFNADGAVVASTTTAGDGAYRFDEVLPGVPVYVQVNLPADHAFAPQDVGSDDAADSDVAQATGRSAAFMPVAGQTMRLDAGVVRLPTIQGIVYLDADGDGLRDAAESGLNTWVVFADLNNNGQLDAGEPSAITRADGSYSLSVASPGTYTIQLVGQDLWTPVPARAITLDARQVLSGIDWGNRTAVPTTIVGATWPQTLIGTGYASAVAMVPDGQYVILRMRPANSGSQAGLCAQRYDAAGTPLGSEIYVSDSVETYYNPPSIACDTTGSFVVVWLDTQRRVMACRFDSTGVAQGNAFQVSPTGVSCDTPSLGVGPNGDFVITWRYVGDYANGWDLLARHYNAAGVSQGDPFPIATRIVGDQQYAAVGVDAAGDFTIAWESWFKDSTDHCIQARRFNSAGEPLGDEFRVSGQSPADQLTPSLAMDRNGDFVVAWQSYRQDGDSGGIYAQRYNAAGVPQGSEFRVNTTTAGDQRYQAIAKSPEGGFVIAWQSMGQDGSGWGIYAQRYNSAGLPQGGEFQVNTFTANSQTDPRVAIDAAGN